MPGLLLHVGASVVCAHGGRAESSVPYPRVTVSGQPIVLQTAPHSVTGCPFVAGTVASPCVVASWTSGAVRVKAIGGPVLLQSSQAVCAPNGTPVTIVNLQTRVSGL
jgi:hypothetical protein